MTYTPASSFFEYTWAGKRLEFTMITLGTVGGTPDSAIYLTLPAPSNEARIRVAGDYPCFACRVVDNATKVAGTAALVTNQRSLVRVARYDSANFTAGSVELLVSGHYYTEESAPPIRAQLEEQLRVLSRRVDQLERGRG